MSQESPSVPLTRSQESISFADIRSDIVQQDMIDNVEQRDVCQERVSDIGQSGIQERDSACQGAVSDTRQCSIQERDSSVCQAGVTDTGQSSIYEVSNHGKGK